MKRDYSRLTPPISCGEEVKVGDNIVVRRCGTEKCVATVIEIKDSEVDYQGAESAAPLAITFEPNLLDIERTPPPMQRPKLFYIHYNGMDRRLDEWVDEEKVLFGEDVLETPTLTPLPADAANKKLTRSQRRIQEEFHHLQRPYEDLDATTAKLEREHEERTKVKNIEKIEFGDYEIDAWYFSPFPLQQTINKSKLFFCEFCLWYTGDMLKYVCHISHYCKQRQPFGEMIYDEGNLAIYEVPGRTHKSFCQSLCLLSKLFLDHKTLYYDVEGFLFYILYEVSADGVNHMVGHFSKEVNSANNLACIMVLPPFQRKGYGKLLIQLSYCLSENEGIIGTPEKPLSDLGKVSYRSYWWWVLLKVLDEQHLQRSHISVAQLSRLSKIHIDDIIGIFHTLQLIKYWKGDHVVRVNKKIVKQIKQLNIYHPPKLILDPSSVKCTPRK